MNKSKIFSVAIACMLTFTLSIGVLAGCVTESEKAKMYKIVFYNVDEVHSTISTEADAKITLPEAPIKEGYFFSGWFFDEDLWLEPFHTNSLTEKNLTEDDNVYAKWVKDTSMYKTLKFNSNSGSAVTDVKDEEIEKPPITNRDSYNFDGWYTDSGFATASKVEFPYSITSDVTFYAKWIKMETEGFEFEKKGESYSITGYNGTSSVVSMPDTYKGLPVTHISDSVFVRNNNITKVIMPNLITYIHGIIFYDCKNLETVVLPRNSSGDPDNLFLKCFSLANVEVNAYDKNYSSVDGVVFNYDKTKIVYYPIGRQATTYTIPASVERIGTNAFGGSQHLVNMIIPATIIDLGAAAFDECVNLTSVVIKSSISDIKERTFSDCRSLKSVEMPNSLKSISASAFSRCTSLENVQIPSSVESIGSYAFSGCTSLESMQIPSGVASIGLNAFSNCTNLKSVELIDGVRVIKDEAFSGCISLKSINLPSSLLIIENNAFENCKILANVVFPDNLKVIGTEAFKNCSSIQNLVIPASVIKIENAAFDHCDMLVIRTVLAVPNSEWNAQWTGTSSTGALIPIIWDSNNNSSNTDSDGNIYYNKDGITYQLKNNVAKIYSIDNNSVQLVIPAIITVDEVNYPLTDINISMFNYCNSLTSITLEGAHANFSSDENGVLYNADKTELIIYPSGKPAIEYTIPDSVTTVSSRAFLNCTALQTLNLGKNIIIFDSSIKGCTGLNEFVVDAGNANYSSDEYGVLFNKDKSILRRYPIGAKAKSYNIPEGVTSITPDAFAGCANLIDVKIPSSLVIISYRSFTDFVGLKSIIIPNTVTGIDAHAFSGCVNLIDVKIGDNVTSIGDFAFNRCYSLSKINIPDGITVIESFTFSECSNLRFLNLPTSLTTIHRYAFNRCSAFEFLIIPISVIIIDEYAFNRNIDLFVEALSPPVGWENIEEEVGYIHWGGTWYMHPNGFPTPNK